MRTTSAGSGGPSGETGRISSNCGASPWNTCATPNLLYAYTPLAQGLEKSTFTTAKSGYPGDAYVDIIGIDNYTGRGDSIAASARLAVEIAESRGKIAALTEVGPGSGLPRDRATHFFTEHLLEPLKSDPVAGRIAYALVWRNSSTGHFWTPPPSHPDADDLRKFRQDSWTVFEDDLPDVYKMRRAVGSRQVIL